MIHAGDLFDVWNPPVELVNWLMRQIREPWYVIFGQHDMPNHDHRQIGRSGYWTMVEAEKVVNLYPGNTIVQNTGKGPVFTITGFPWGFDPGPPGSFTVDYLNICVMHRYLYNDARRNAHPHAGPEACVYEAIPEKVLRSYDTILIGDNHKFWNDRWGDPGNPTSVWNGGTFIRRKADERDHVPAVGVVMSDGTVVAHPLDTFGDVWAETPAGVTADDAESADFIATLAALRDARVNFRDAAARELDRRGASAAVRELVMSWIDEVGL